MPCHAPVPSDATAGEEADAMRPPRAPPRNLRGFQLGARRARGGLGGDLGGLGGHQSIKKSSTRHSRRFLSNSERPSCHIGGQLRAGAKYQLAAGIGAGGTLWVSGLGCGRRHLLCLVGVEASAKVRTCTMKGLWSKGAIRQVEKGG